MSKRWQRDALARIRSVAKLAGASIVLALTLLLNGNAAWAEGPAVAEAATPFATAGIVTVGTLLIGLSGLVLGLYRWHRKRVARSRITPGAAPTGTAIHNGLSLRSHGSQR